MLSPFWSRVGALLSVLSSVTLLVACGSAYETTKVKSYKLSLVEGDTTFVDEFKKLIDDFNAQAGIHVLDYVDSAADANSAIVVTKGLKATSDGKVGLGQWLSETKADSQFAAMPGQRLSRTVVYSMRVEFDYDFFQSRITETQANRYDKEKLFFHEVGHGLEMNHNVGGANCDAPHTAQDERNVMFCDIAGDKDFAPHFQRVRDYMADQ